MVTYMIPCLLGLEKLVADEVKRLGLQDVQAENGRILCRGTAADCARLNINLRCGARVMMVLGQFPARSFEELFQGVRAIPAGLPLAHRLAGHLQLLGKLLLGQAAAAAHR